MPSPRALALLAVLPAAAALPLACGSRGAGELPPAAEPRIAPPLTVAPAGRVVRVGPPIGALSAGRRERPGGAPEGLAIDPGSGVIAVGLRRPPGLGLLDGRTGRLRRLVDLPGRDLGPRHLALGPVGTVLVPAEGGDGALVVRARDGRVLSDGRTGPRPHDLSPAVGGRVVVGDEGGAALTVLRGGRPERTIAVARQPGGLAPLDGGRRVAVVSVRERVLEIADPLTGRVLERADAGVGPTHVAALGRWIWVVDTQGDALLVFDREGGLELVRRVRVPHGPYGLALDPVRERLWVTLSGANQLIEYPATGRPVAKRRFPTVRQADSVAVDSATGRLALAGRDAGVVQLLAPGASTGAQRP